jgi:hypothetical protein
MFALEMFLILGEDMAKRQINPLNTKDGIPSFHVIESARARDLTRARNLSRPTTSDER